MIQGDDQYQGSCSSMSQADLGETTDVALKNATVLNYLRAAGKKIIDGGRSR